MYNNSHTSRTPIDLDEIPHIFYTQIIHTHCLRALTVYIYIYIYMIEIMSGLILKNYKNYKE